ncbi:MAG: DUF2600 family protein [Candidatus Eremiobacteraeota bacterium]|nr:DUF2600 family protein [Candidatus Eremiobacteraeota bacterium]MBC5826543.1 DUF2600 family protein [Candidatus Eremiobacteraeota bacterium]
MDRHTLSLASRFVTRVIPGAAAELKALRRRAAAIPHQGARREALASIDAKAFHVHGGCILATFLSGDALRRYVKLVATYETAVDYLDNLCDRIGTGHEADFRALHESLIDALHPAAPRRDYFRHRDYDDGGYLDGLVADCQRYFGALPSYERIVNHADDITQRYCDLQSRKHLAPGERERQCITAFSAVAPQMSWWEGAAACGSTMPTFALAYAALETGLSAARAQDVRDAYFPYFSATHILLDYFIDQAEDREHGELNFVACYPSSDDARAGMVGIARAALAKVGALPDGYRHAFALRAMCAFYCSRPKIRRQALTTTAQAILRAVDVDSLALVQPLLRLYANLAGRD